MTTVYNKNGIAFDIDALATDVNGKADKDLINVSSNASVCIESWHEGTKWYRVYSDGWCEQGEYATGLSNTEVHFDFLKTFDSLLGISIQRKHTNNADPGEAYINRRYSEVWNVSNSGFNTWGNWGDSTEIYWRAEGYIR